ncbi:SDR family NAD(P)-dependent oxidoreductase, partial [Streptomyces sp. NPDC002530]
AEVDAVEAHGTGTTLGDPIEAQALLATYGQDRPEGQPLWLGSIKSNIGHTQAAAGVAGLIKMVQAMHHEVLPGTLHVGEPSTHIDWTAGAVELLTEARPWPRGERPRRAGVSSFGISGTNAHVIIEEAPAAAPAPEPSVDVTLPVVPWPVSAKTPAALAAQAGRLESGTDGRSAVDVGLSLATTRAALDHRAVVLGTGTDDLRAELSALSAGQPTPRTLTARARAGSAAFVFSGQGGQRVGMGRELADSFPVFAEALDEVCAHFDALLDRPLRDVVFEDAEALKNTGWAQPALFAVEVALYRLVESWGVRPDYLAGHSVGELAAAHVAGVLSLADAARLVAARAGLMQALPSGGAMWAVRARLDEVAPLLVEGVSVAAVNAPGQVVLSGTREAVEAVAARLSGRQSRWLEVSHAFHSSLMDPMLDAFTAVAAELAYETPRIPIVSTLTGEPVTEFSAAYWTDQVRGTVRFADAVTRLKDLGVTRFLELGPDATLTGAIEETYDGDVLAVAALNRKQPEPATAVTALAHLWAHGTEVDWAAFYAPTGARTTDLPTYAFQHQSYWPQAPARRHGDVTAAGLSDAGHPLLGAAVPLAGDDGRLFTARIGVRDLPWLADHEVMGTILFPGTGFLELAMRAGDEAGCDRVEELTLAAPLVLPPDGTVQLQLRVGAPDATGLRPLTLHARRDDAPAGTPWTLHATGLLGEGRPEPSHDLTAWPPPGAEPVDVSEFYAMYRQGGFAYGPSFQGLRRAWTTGDEVYVDVVLDEPHATEAAAYGLHPPLLDAALQALTFLALDGTGTSRLPFSWSGVSLYAYGASSLRVRLSKAGPDALALDLADGTGQPVARVESLAMRQVSAAQLHSSPAEAARPKDVFRLDWLPVSLPDAAPVTGRAWAVLGDTDTGPDPLGLADALEARLVPGLDALGADGPVPDVVFVPCAGTGPSGAADATTMAADVRALTARVLDLLQRWLSDSRYASARLVLVTSGAVDAGDADGPGDPAAAAVWGLVRSAQSEEPGRFVLADLGPDTLTDGTAAGLFAALLASDEAQVAFRDGTVRAARLVRPAPDDSLLPPAGAEAWRLDSTARGSLANLTLAADPELLEPLGPDEVRVAVKAAGLNFRDVLNALDMYPGEPGPMGVEGAGVITEVGPDVTGFAPGDRVLGMFGKAFGPVSVADHRMIAPMPEDWTFEQAASVPVVFLTAYYALVDLAGLKPGESVLVHAAAGGVGMAAAQLARHLGAEVYGTAGPAKHDTLRSLGIDDAHLASSRDLAFEEHFRTTAGTGGIDVVLNSLAREYVDASLRLLGGGGRFLEMGKTDVRTPESITEAHPGVSYAAFDLIEAGPARIGEMLTEILRLVAAGALHPLPLATWDVRRAPEAYRHVSQARHIGKVVLTLPGRPDPDGTVLVTGGTGGLGHYVARHLVEHHGVRNLLLTSRSGPRAEGAAGLAAELEKLGARVRIEACDAADRDALARTLAGIDTEHPLTAVVHVAGVVDDGVIPFLTPDRLDTTLRPKADAALNLYELTKDSDLAALVLFSGAAGTLGGAGQANYAAANAFLDEFARWARHRGAPAVALAWGPWIADRGMTGHLTDNDIARMAKAGLQPLDAPAGLALLDFALTTDEAALLPMRLDTSPQAFTAGPVPPMLRHLAGSAAPRRAQAATASAPEPADALAGRLRALPAADRTDHLLDLVCGQAAAVLGHGSAEDIDPDEAFLGFDSLTAIELRNRMGALTGTRLPATLVFDYPTPASLVAYLLAELVPDTAPDPATAPGTVADASTAGSAALDEIERLEQALDRLAGSDDATVRRRLRALAERWGDGAGAPTTTGAESGPPADDEADALASATADELFRMIDGEFGGTS